MLKKGLYLFAILTMTMVFFTINCSAYSNPSASNYEFSSGVYVEGVLSSNMAGRQVALLMVNSDADVVNMQNVAVKYIAQTTVAEDGSYKFKFSYNGNIDECKLLVNQDGRIINSSITKAVATDRLLKVDLDLKISNSLAKAMIEIENLYGDTTKTYNAFLACYSEDRTLLKLLSTGDKNTSSDITTDILSDYFPSETAKIKAFVFSGLETIIPLCESKMLDLTAERAITCWGDSLTAGAGGNGVTYPDVLAQLSGKMVYNMGVGGEAANTIAARQGGLQMLLSSFVIPATATAVKIEMLASNSTCIYPLLQDPIGAKGINPCYINDVKGILSYTGGDYYFTRSESGEPVNVSIYTPIVTDAMRSRRGDVLAIFIGQNMGYSSYEELVAIQRSMIDYMNYDDKQYVIIGLTTGTAESRSVLEALMESEYGDRFINMREYLSTQGMEDAGLTPTNEDISYMNLGKVPPSLLSDSTHFNQYGYGLIGNKVYERMCELGFIY